LHMMSKLQRRQPKPLLSGNFAWNCLQWYSRWSLMGNSEYE